MIRNRHNLCGNLDLFVDLPKRSCVSSVALALLPEPASATSARVPVDLDLDLEIVLGSNISRFHSAISFASTTCWVSENPRGFALYYGRNHVTERENPHSDGRHKIKLRFPPRWIFCQCIESRVHGLTITGAVLRLWLLEDQTEVISACFSSPSVIEGPMTPTVMFYHRNNGLSIPKRNTKHNGKTMKDAVKQKVLFWKHQKV